GRLDVSERSPARARVAVCDSLVVQRYVLDRRRALVVGHALDTGVEAVDREVRKIPVYDPDAEVHADRAGVARVARLDREVVDPARVRAPVVQAHRAGIAAADID